MSPRTIPAPLSGKVAVITGASKGIGAAVAVDFARKGCSHIAITYLTDLAGAEKVLKEIAAVDASIKTAAFVTDIRKEDCGRKTIEEALRLLGVDRIDILVSNAGLKSPLGLTPALEATKADFDLLMMADAWTPLQLAQAVYPHMPPGGRIIMCSSTSTKTPYGDPVALHSMAKSAMEALTRNLAASWSKEKGITVNSVSIGATSTESMRNTIEVMGEETRKAAEAYSLFNRIGTPEEVASIISFIASPDASWITGTLVPANGGALTPLQG